MDWHRGGCFAVRLARERRALAVSTEAWTNKLIVESSVLGNVRRRFVKQIHLRQTNSKVYISMRSTGSRCRNRSDSGPVLWRGTSKRAPSQECHPLEPAWDRDRAAGRLHTSAGLCDHMMPPAAPCILAISNLHDHGAKVRGFGRITQNAVSPRSKMGSRSWFPEPEYWWCSDLAAGALACTSCDAGSYYGSTGSCTLLLANWCFFHNPDQIAQECSILSRFSRTGSI